MIGLIGKTQITELKQQIGIIQVDGDSFGKASDGGPLSFGLQVLRDRFLQDRRRDKGRFHSTTNHYGSRGGFGGVSECVQAAVADSTRKQSRESIGRPIDESSSSDDRF